MRKLLILITLFSPCCFAETQASCLKAVTGGLTLNEAYETEVAAAKSWMDWKLKFVDDFPEALLHDADFQIFADAHDFNWASADKAARKEFAAKFLFAQWQRWNQVSPLVRGGYLSLELNAISPIERAHVLNLDGPTRLKTLSEANRNRLIAELDEKYPEATESAKSARLVGEIGALARLISFHYFYSDPVVTEQTTLAPLVSPRELGRLGLDANRTFYSELLGGSPGVPLNLVATNPHDRPMALDGDSARTYFEVFPRFALEEGLMLPSFRHALDLWDFFKESRPELLEQVFQRSRFSVPSHIQDKEAFRAYITPSSSAKVFTGDSIANRLYPLRSALSQYVMTASDGETFLKARVRHLHAPPSRLKLRDFLKSAWSS